VCVDCSEEINAPYRQRYVGARIGANDDKILNIVLFPVGLICNMFLFIGPVSFFFLFTPMYMRQLHSFILII